MRHLHEAYLDLKTDFEDLDSQYGDALRLIKRLEIAVDKNEAPDVIKAEIQGFKMGLQDLHNYLTLRI